jgi:hypothetical protein
MEIKRLALRRGWLIIFISLISISCASLAPVAVEDGDEGLILIIDSSIIPQVVGNWGLENGYQYVAYRRLQGGTESTNASSRAQFTSQVLVIGIDDPNDAPERFNVVASPTTPYKEMTENGTYFLGTGIAVGSLLLILLLLL